MAKSNIKARPINEIIELLKKEPLPIYYFFGEDSFSIEKAISLIKKTYSELLTSEFDNETIHATQSTNINEIISLASSFPFGSEKKSVYVKKFNLIKDKKDFVRYIESPSDLTILIIVDESKKINTNSQPFKALAENGYLFEAKKIKGSEWISWIKVRAKELKLIINDENAERLFEIVGDEKQLLMRQLEKLRDYLGEGETISKEDILKLTSPTKKYTTFELQDAFLKGKKDLTLKIGFHLLSNGIQLYEILPLLISAVYILAQSLELRKKYGSTASYSANQSAAKEAGVHPFYYKKISSSPYFTTEKRIANAARALLEADATVKTTASPQKNVFLELITKIFSV